MIATIKAFWRPQLGRISNHEQVVVKTELDEVRHVNRGILARMEAIIYANGIERTMMGHGAEDM